MIISDRIYANKKYKMLPRDQKLLPKIGVFLVFQKYLKQDLVFSVKLHLAFKAYPYGLIPYLLGLNPQPLSLDPWIPESLDP